MKATTTAFALLALALLLPVPCSAEAADPLARVHEILITRHVALSAIAATPSTPPFAGALASAGAHLALAAAHAFESTGHLEDLAAAHGTPDIEHATAQAVDALERTSRECKHAGAALTLIGTLAADPEHLAGFVALFLTPADQHVTSEDLSQAAREHASAFRSEIRKFTEEVYSNAAIARKKATALSESRFHFGALTALPLADFTRSFAHYLADHSANFASLITRAQAQHPAPIEFRSAPRREAAPGHTARAPRSRSAPRPGKVPSERSGHRALACNRRRAVYGLAPRTAPSLTHLRPGSHPALNPTRGMRCER